MNRGEAVRVVATLSAAYPSWNAGKETVGVYVELLKDLEYEQVLEAVSDLICTEEWCPSVATVRRRVAAKKGVLAPPAVEAWDEVIDKVRQVGLRGGGAEWSHPAIKQTVRAIGWNQICQSTNVDHARAIDMVFHNGRNGETYNIGGFNEWQNIELVKLLCKEMDEKLGRKPGESEKLITYIKDRPGHDRRYAIDANKINKELGWYPSVTFEEGLSKTIDWYLANEEWLNHVTSGDYQKYYQKQYASNQ